MADVMILFGSGGHSSEMLMLMQNARLVDKLTQQEFNRLICVISDDDRLIGEKIASEFDEIPQQQRHKLELVRLKRGRKVGQSYLTAIWTTIIGIMHSVNIVLRHKPKLCLTNGPSISVTISLAIRCLQVLTFGLYYRCSILYVESFCRTKSLSLSGRLIYHLQLADEFYVQWPTLKALYPRARYEGFLV